jgi:hypothetical protein
VAVSSVDVAGNESAKCSAVSATALASAATVADRSITQAKLALDIRPPKLSASAPTLPATDYPAGSIYYNTTDKCLYKTTDGNAWVKMVGAGDIQADSITAGQIAAGAIGASELASNSVFAHNLIVANYDNLIPNPTSEQDLTGAPSGAFEAIGVTTADHFAGSKCRVVPSNGSTTSLYITPYIPVLAGESYYMSAMARLTAASGTGAAIGVTIYDATGAVVSTYLSNYKTGTSWGASAATPDLSGTFTVDSTGVSMRFFLQWASSPAAGQSAYFDNLFLRRMNDGNLIVDGSVTASDIAAGTITAAKLNVADVQAAVVTAAKINALNLNAVNITGGNITGVTITGTTLQTSASGARVVISSNDVKRISFYSGTANETTPGSVACLNSGTNASVLEIDGPFYGGSSPIIQLGSSLAGASFCLITGLNASVSVGDSSGVTKVTGDLNVTGKINPATNFSSGTSSDGIWVQDSGTTSQRWKLYFDSSTKRLYVRRDASTYSYIAVSASGGY